jgi:hypothetical protein
LCSRAIDYEDGGWISRHFSLKASALPVKVKKPVFSAMTWAKRLKRMFNIDMDPTIALTCCSQFGSRKVYFRLAFRIGVK